MRPLIKRVAVRFDISAKGARAQRQREIALPSSNPLVLCVPVPPLPATLKRCDGECGGRRPWLPCCCCCCCWSFFLDLWIRFGRIHAPPASHHPCVPFAHRCAAYSGGLGWWMDDASGRGSEGGRSPLSLPHHSPLFITPMCCRMGPCRCPQRKSFDAYVTLACVIAPTEFAQQGV